MALDVGVARSSSIEARTRTTTSTSAVFYRSRARCLLINVERIRIAEDGEYKDQSCISGTKNLRLVHTQWCSGGRSRGVSCAHTQRLAAIAAWAGGHQEDVRRGWMRLLRGGRVFAEPHHATGDHLCHKLSKQDRNSISSHSPLLNSDPLFVVPVSPTVR